MKLFGIIFLFFINSVSSFATADSLHPIIDQEYRALFVTSPVFSEKHDILFAKGYPRETFTKVYRNEPGKNGNPGSYLAFGWDRRKFNLDNGEGLLLNPDQSILAHSAYSYHPNGHRQYGLMIRDTLSLIVQDWDYFAETGGKAAVFIANRKILSISGDVNAKYELGSKVLIHSIQDGSAKLELEKELGQQILEIVPFDNFSKVLAQTSNKIYILNTNDLSILWERDRYKNDQLGPADYFKASINSNRIVISTRHYKQVSIEVVDGSTGRIVSGKRYDGVDLFADLSDNGEYIFLTGGGDLPTLYKSDTLEKIREFPKSEGSIHIVFDRKNIRLIRFCRKYAQNTLSDVVEIYVLNNPEPLRFRIPPPTWFAGSYGDKKISIFANGTKLKVFDQGSQWEWRVRIYEYPR